MPIPCQLLYIFLKFFFLLLFIFVCLLTYGMYIHSVSEFRSRFALIERQATAARASRSWRGLTPRLLFRCSGHPLRLASPGFALRAHLAAAWNLIQHTALYYGSALEAPRPRVTVWPALSRVLSPCTHKGRDEGCGPGARKGWDGSNFRRACRAGKESVRPVGPPRPGRRGAEGLGVAGGER